MEVSLAPRATGRQLMPLALRLANGIVSRARAGGYALHAPRIRHAINPTLFQGTAGIGYTLLRLFTTDLPNLAVFE
jgi:lantibiotic modifying enzyme